MENSMARKNYARHPVAPRRRRRSPQTGSSGLKQIMVRQLIICLILLIMVIIIKNINISITNFATEKVKYVLSYHVELENVFSTIEKYVTDIRSSIIPVTADKSGSDDASDLTGTSTSSTTPTSSTAPASSTTPASTTTPATIAAPQIATIDDADSTYETSVLGISSENEAIHLQNMILPVHGTLSSLYGERIDAAAETGRIHHGIDISVETVSNIVAVLDGEVIDAGSTPAYGNFLKLSHADGIETIYANCSTLIAQKGNKVKQGDVIANLDSKASSAGLHLHFEIWKDGNTADPLEYISVPAG